MIRTPAAKDAGSGSKLTTRQSERLMGPNRLD